MRSAATAAAGSGLVEAARARFGGSMPRSGEPGRERSYRCVTVIVWVRLEVVAVIVPLRVVPGEGLGATVKVNVTGILPTEPPPLIHGTDVVTCAPQFAMPFHSGGKAETEAVTVN